MLREMVYLVGAAFGITTVYYFLIPVYQEFVNSFTPVASQQITDPAFSTELVTLPVNMGLIIQYAFIAVLVGLGIYAALVPFRKEPQEFNR